MNEQKLCESAYLTGNDSQQGSFVHGAAMIDRTSGTRHVYLVRGECTDSVVTELHRQLVTSGRLPRSTRRRAVATPNSLLWTTAVLALGVLAALFGAVGR